MSRILLIIFTFAVFLTLPQPSVYAEIRTPTVEIDVSTIILKPKVVVLSAKAAVIPKAVFAQTINLQPPGSAIPPAVTLNDVVRFIINLLILIGIVLSLIFLIYGGIRWILSGGDKNAVEAARGTVTAAIIGLIIVISAFVIINLVLQLLGIGPLTSLRVPTLVSPG